MNSTQKYLAVMASVALAMGALVASPSFANGDPITQLQIPVCDGTSRGQAVCYEGASSSLKRSISGSPTDIPFDLYFSDGSGSNGGGAFALNVNLKRCVGENPDPYCAPDSSGYNSRAPLSGDVGRFTVLYPNLTSEIDDISGAVFRGDDLADASFAITKAKSFDFRKSVSGSVIQYDIEIEFSDVWDRQDCGFDFSDVNFDTFFAPPTASCNQPNKQTDPDGENSFNYVWEEIGFFTFEEMGFVSEEMDGGYLNFLAPTLSNTISAAISAPVSSLTIRNGIAALEVPDSTNSMYFYPNIGDKFFLQGISEVSVPPVVTVTDLGFQEGEQDEGSALIYFDLSGVSDGTYVLTDAFAISPGAFEFQVAGPKFASGTDLNVGALEIFIPEAQMTYIFGSTSSVSVSDLLAQRIDVVNSDTVNVSDLSVQENGLTTSALRGGLRISVASHLFSAPGFSFASLARNPIESISRASSSVAMPPTAREVDVTISRKSTTKVRLSKLRALAGFSLKPGQTVRVRIAKESRLDCRIRSARVLSLTGESCVVRLTKLKPNGDTTGKIKFIRIEYRIQ
jgi:hypothetical protein